MKSEGGMAKKETYIESSAKQKIASLVESYILIGIYENSSILYCKYIKNF